MATFTSASAIGEREDLSDVIYRIDPDETPLFSNAQKETTRGIITEWQVQELAASVDDNHASEGADFSYTNPSATTRFLMAAQQSNLLRKLCELREHLSQK